MNKRKQLWIHHHNIKTLFKTMYHFIMNLCSNSLFQNIILQSLLIIYQIQKSVIDWKFTKLKIRHSGFLAGKRYTTHRVLHVGCAELDTNYELGGQATELTFIVEKKCVKSKLVVIVSMLNCGGIPSALRFVQPPPHRSTLRTGCDSSEFREHLMKMGKNSLSHK